MSFCLNSVTKNKFQTLLLTNFSNDLYFVISKSPTLYFKILYMCFKGIFPNIIQYRIIIMYRS